MYTATITGKSIQRAARQVVVDVEFSDGASTFSHKFTFAFDVSFDTVKQAIKQYISKLEQIDANISTITDGAVDLTGVSDGALTQAEKNKQLWIERDALKEKVDTAIAKGYLTGTEVKVKQLKTWLKNNFKPEYLDLV